MKNQKGQAPQEDESDGIKRAVIYTRVSTEDQAEKGFSLEAQKDRLRSYCKAKGWEVVGEFIDDGYSGRDENRPAYQKMLAEREGWDVLVVMKMDRIHRNSKNFTVMMDRLKQWDKEFTSMQESFDTTTAMGRFVMDIIQRIAQLESEQIGERVKTGMMQKAKEGRGYLGFNIPYGYNYEDGGLEINEEEAEIVKEIFESYLESKTIGQIKDSLNERKISTKRNNKWAKMTVQAILRNPIYCGYYHWETNDILKIKHEQIIEVTLFNQVQRKRFNSIRNKNMRKNVPLLIDVDLERLVPVI